MFESAPKYATLAKRLRKVALLSRTKITIGSDNAQPEFVFGPRKVRAPLRSKLSKKVKDRKVLMKF